MDRRYEASKRSLVPGSHSSEAALLLPANSGCLLDCCYMEGLSSSRQLSPFQLLHSIRMLGALQGAQRRCLVIRAAAAAAAGHSGAQLAVLKEAAVGARVKVWWPLDEDWYSGSLTGFDPIRHRHTVHYDDGDVEIIPLWAPNQMVSLHIRSVPSQDHMKWAATNLFEWCALCIHLHHAHDCLCKRQYSLHLPVLLPECPQVVCIQPQRQFSQAVQRLPN